MKQLDLFNDVAVARDSLLLLHCTCFATYGSGPLDRLLLQLAVATRGEKGQLDAKLRVIVILFFSPFSARAPTVVRLLVHSAPPSRKRHAIDLITNASSSPPSSRNLPATQSPKCRATAATMFYEPGKTDHGLTRDPFKVMPSPLPVASVRATSSR